MKWTDIEQFRVGKVLLMLKKEFLWVGVFSLVANVLMLTPTLYMLQIYDRVMKSGSELTLFVLTGIVLYLFAVMGVAEWLRSRLLVRIGVRLDEELNSLLFHAGFSAFLRNESHNTVQMFNDLTNIRQFLTGVGVIAFFDMPWTPVYILVMFMLHPVLGLIGLVFAAVQVMSAWKKRSALAERIEGASDAHVNATGYVQGKLGNIDAVYAMGMLEPLRERWLVRHEASVLAAEEFQKLQQREQSYAKFTRYLMQSFTLAAGAVLVLRGEASSGVMIAGSVLMARALAPLDMMVSTAKQYAQAFDGFRRIETLLDGFAVPEQTLQSQDLRGVVRIDGLVATARQGTVPILNAITAEFRPGEIVAIIGSSGSGKSTLARCCIGVWPESNGNVLIDGIPVGEWDRSILGPHIGYLPQDVELFEGSVAENIARFGEVDPEKVVAAATKAGIHDMVLSFSKGYDTAISFGGKELSGGQRQRLAFARALYDNASILVLDEPDANLDEAGEGSLKRALRKAADEGRTVCVITHRPGVVALADRVMVMSAGRILHDGSRDDVSRELMKSKSK